MPACPCRTGPGVPGLLAAADVRQTDEEFLATAELVAAVAPGGREAVREAVAELLPRRLDVLRAWDATAVQTVPLEPQIVQSARRGEPQVEVVDVTAPEDAVPAASAAPAAEDRSAPAVTVTDAADAGEETERHWSGYVEWFHPHHWDGRAKAGVALDQGNTDQSDYSLAIEVSPAPQWRLGPGWQDRVLLHREQWQCDARPLVGRGARRAPDGRRLELLCRLHL